MGDARKPKPVMPIDPAWILVDEEGFCLLDLDGTPMLFETAAAAQAHSDRGLMGDFGQPRRVRIVPEDENGR